MKKYFIQFVIISLFFSFLPVLDARAAMPEKLKGKFVIAVQDKGKLFYINPTNSEKYYFNDATGLFRIVKAVGLGISNKNFKALNKKALTKFSGRILIKVEDGGKAFYVEPVTLKFISLGRPLEIFRIIAKLSIGVPNKIISQIKANKNFPEKIKPSENVNQNHGSDNGTANNGETQPTVTPDTTAATSSEPTNNSTSTNETVDNATSTDMVATATPACVFLGEYYANKSFVGDPATSSDEAINFDWGNQGPSIIDTINKFSIRWTAKCYFTAGKYKFTGIFDDALRAYIDDENFMQSWADNERTMTIYRERDIAEGWHNIRVDYYDYYGKALAKFSWEKLQ